MKIVGFIEGALISWLSVTGIFIYSIGSGLGGLEGLILSIIAVGNGNIAGLRLGLFLKMRITKDQEILIQF
jgi:hypothetical protein